MLQELLPWLYEPAFVERLNQVATYVLVAAGILGLVAIAGGGEIAVRDFKIGNLRPPSRILAAVTSVVLAAVWVVAPSPVKAPKVAIAGKIILGPGGNFETNPVKIGLQREPKDVVTTVVRSDLSFDFPPSDQLPEGTYQLVMYGVQDEPIGRTPIGLQHDEELIVTKVSAEDYEQNSFANAAETVKRARDDYAEHKWQLKVQKIQYLNGLAKVIPEVAEELRLQINSTDPLMKDLVAFASPPQNCSREVVSYLWGIVENENESPYRKLRAAWTVVCDIGQRDSATEFLRQHVVPESEPSIRRTASYFLAKLGSRTECVVANLIGGLESQSDFVRNLANEALIEVTSQDFQKDIGRWKAWFNDEAELTPCLWLEEANKLSGDTQ